jgi:2-amino-4-hydroxy-6-hydroxymethyldihydropteridine diphosphokinase
MARVYLGLGSNIEREYYIGAGLDALAALFGELELSPVYDCRSMGFAGQPFLNLVAGIDTELAVGELATRLRRVETDHGRPQNAQRNSPRRLDIDILTYDRLCGVFDGVELPRAEILYHAFVLRPLSDLVPEGRHPTAGKTYRELWAAFDQREQEIEPVSFNWRGRALPCV